MDETVLGFQLRIAPQDLELWDAQRRAMYLLREDIRIPLSVDTSVWPESRDNTLLSSLFADFSTTPNSAPNGLALYALKSFAVLSHPASVKDPFLIGVSVVGEVARELQDQHCIKSFLPITELVSNNWICLGYDVADYWLLSGLFNCGYDAAGKPSLSQRFGANLNEYGLFASANTAWSFGFDCNARVPEHAPFAVYGIWKQPNQKVLSKSRCEGVA